MPRRDHLNQLITIHTRRLQKLREQQAFYGPSIDPAISLEIEDIETELSKLHPELAELDQSDLVQEPNGHYRRVGRLFSAPPLPSHFTGRADLRAQLKSLLTANTGLVIALHGMGGVGKTALARQLAEELRPHFPGGIFWADLPTTHGNIASIFRDWSRVWPADELAEVAIATPSSALRDWSQTGQAVLAEQDATTLSQIMRDLLTGRCTKVGRLLVVMNDVRSAWLRQAKLLKQSLPDQVSLVLTTRDDILARELGARFWDEVYHLDKLTVEEALALLSAYAGPALVERETQTAAALLARLGYLPLALKLAGYWLAQYSRKYRRPIAVLDKKLTERGLGGLDEELDWLQEEQMGLFATFSFTYDEALDAELQRLFRGLALFASEAFRLSAVAGVLGLRPAWASMMLDKLVGLALLTWQKTQTEVEDEEDIDRVYLIHPLLKQYSLFLLEKSGEVQSGRQAYLDYYLALAESHAQNTVEAHQRLESELPDLLYAAKLAAEMGQHRVVSNFGLALWERGEFLLTRGYYREAQVLLNAAIQASETLQDEAATAIHLKNIGQSYDILNNAEQAEIYYLKSLNYYQGPHENSLQHCDLRYYLASLYVTQQKYQQATQLVEQNLAAASQLQDAPSQKRTEAQSYHILSNIAIYQQRWAEAEQYANNTLELYTLLADVKGQVGAYYNLAIILARQGIDLNKARAYYQLCLGYWEKTSNLTAQIYVLLQMSMLEREQANYSLVFKYLDQAQTISQRGNNLFMQIAVRRHRGLTYLAQQNTIEACQEWQSALELAQANNLSYWPQEITALLTKHCSELDNINSAD
jgi:tetratricopeptide (TPR) repeat protein